MNNKILYRLWCEYDFGFDNYLFSNEVQAFAYAQKVIEEQDEGWNFQGLIDDHLIGTIEMEYIE